MVYNMAKIVKNISIESRIKNLRIVENEIDELTESIGVKQDNYGKIMVAAMEAVNNAINMGINRIRTRWLMSRFHMIIMK